MVGDLKIKMGIILLVIFNRTGELLFSRFFEEDVPSTASASLEHKLREHFRIYFNRSEGSSSSAFPIKRCITLADTHFLMDLIGELYFVVGGKDDCDEIVLSDIVDSLRSVSEQLEFKMTEGALLDQDNYGKFSVLIDEMMMNGIVENLDAEFVQKMSKLKEI